MIGGRAALLLVGMSLAACAATVTAGDGSVPTMTVADRDPGPGLSGPAATATSAPTRTTATDGSVPGSGAASSTAPPARSFTMAFTGDLLLHSRVNAVARANAADDPGLSYDYGSLLAPIAPLVEAADWAVCHLEVPLSADDTRLSPYPTFRVPGDIARAVRTIGYDACTTASNHVLDQGADGVAETLAVLDTAGLAHTGSARSPQEAQPMWLDLGGIRVAHLAYAYGFNGFTVPSRSPWLANLLDESRILADADAARRQGAEYVVVSLHWGEQYQHEPNRQQQELGPRLLASPSIDLVVGHHAHVVQPIDRLGGKWLVYGLGNLLSASTSRVRRDELLIEVTVTGQAGGVFRTDLRAVPLYLDGVTLVVYPSPLTLRPPDLDAGLRAELDASLARVRAVLETGSGWGELTLGPG